MLGVECLLTVADALDVLVVGAATKARANEGFQLIAEAERGALGDGAEESRRHAGHLDRGRL
jgi:hypothetical protein